MCLLGTNCARAPHDLNASTVHLSAHAHSRWPAADWEAGASVVVERAPCKHPNSSLLFPLLYCCLVRLKLVLSIFPYLLSGEITLCQRGLSLNYTCFMCVLCLVYKLLLYRLPTSVCYSYVCVVSQLCVVYLLLLRCSKTLSLFMTHVRRLYFISCIN